MPATHKILDLQP